MKAVVTVSDRMKRLQTAPVIDRKTALSAVNLELYGKWHRNQECLARAASRPLPGPALEAYISKDIDVAGVKVSRLLPVHIITLDAIGSKILGLFSDSKEERAEAMKMDISEQLDVGFIFTTEDSDALLELAKGLQVSLLLARF